VNTRCILKKKKKENIMHKKKGIRMMTSMEPKMVASYSCASNAPITSTASFDQAFIAKRSSPSLSSKWLVSIASKYLS
jgi:hypothetical protein